MVENTGENKEEINFTMEAKKLSNIFGYLKHVDNQVPVTFYEDKILIRQNDSCNVQYTEIEIREKDLNKYNPGLKHGNKSRNIIIKVGCIALSEMNNMCDVAIGQYDDGQYADRRNYDINVRIKPLDKKIYFHLPGNVIIWAELIDDEQYIKSEFEKLDKMPVVIRKVRSDPNIKKSLVIMDHKVLDKLCDEDSHDGIFTVKIDKKDGLTLVSKTADGFYELILKPKCTHIECEDDNKEYVNICKGYITPFGILNGGPVTVEIRRGKPIVLETKLGEHTAVMLTAAPRVEKEEKEIDCPKVGIDLMTF